MNYEQFTPNYQGKAKDIFLINMTQEVEHHFSQLVQKGISKYLRQGKRIGIILNRKGYSQGLLCQDCGHVPQCQHCSVSIHYHSTLHGEHMGLCHICKNQYPLPTRCPKCGSAKIKEFGLGTQKVAEYLQQEFGASSVIIQSEKVNSPKKVAEVRQQILQSPTPPILIGTSLLTTPIPEYPLDLVIFLQADFGLNIPDYSASEQNFWLLYEAFCKHTKATFLVQSHQVDHRSIRSACKMSPEAFWEQELVFRKDYGYPPFAELALILYKNEVEEKMFNQVDKLHKELLYLREKYGLQDEIQIFTTPPLIYKMFGKYRYTIILKGKQLRNFLDIVYSKLNLGKKGFKINWKAESLV